MDIAQIKKLGGVQLNEADTNAMLDEAVVIADDASLDVIVGMLDAARRGLGFANKLANKEQRLKHVKAIFVNLNKIRAALYNYFTREAK